LTVSWQQPSQILEARALAAERRLHDTPSGAGFDFGEYLVCKLLKVRSPKTPKFAEITALVPFSSAASVTAN